MDEQYVYCFQEGSKDCYKIGRSREPEKRRRNLQTGSADELRHSRCVRTSDASALEEYIHKLLDDRRVGIQEIFQVTEQELDEAIAKAFRFVEEATPFFRRAEALAKQKPDEEMLDPSEEILDIYSELRDAKRRYFMLGKYIELLRCKMKVFIGTHGGITGLATWKWKDHPGLCQAVDFRRCTQRGTQP